MVGTTLTSMDGKLVIYKHSEFPPGMPAVQRVLGLGLRNSVLSRGSGSWDRLARPGASAPEGCVLSPP